MTGRVPVLLYHCIAERSDPRFVEWTVSPDAFAAQMGLIAAAGCEALTVSAYADRLARRSPLPSRAVVITFDDGFADFHDLAWPVLRAHGLTATVYVTTGFVGATSRWLAPAGEGDRPMMSWDHVAAVAAGGVECGAHGVRHLALDTASRRVARAEIEGSRDALREVVGPVRSFAYPHGYHHRGARRLVRAAGFTCACAVGDGLAHGAADRFAIPRVVVRPGLGLDRLERVLAAAGPVAARRPLRRLAWRTARRVGVA